MSLTQKEKAILGAIIMTTRLCKCYAMLISESGGSIDLTVSITEYNCLNITISLHGWVQTENANIRNFRLPIWHFFNHLLDLQHWARNTLSLDRLKCFIFDIMRSDVNINIIIVKAIDYIILLYCILITQIVPNGYMKYWFTIYGITPSKGWDSSSPLH